MTTEIFENKQPTQEKPELEVKIAMSDDLADISKLRIQAAKDKNDAYFLATTQEKEEKTTDKQREEEMLGKDKFVVLVRSGSQPIGMGRAIKKAGEDEVWEMRSGYVDKDFRGKDIGKRIFAERLNEIIKRGGKKVVAGIMVTNPTSIPLAESFGFKIIGTTPKAHSMELSLNSEKLIKKINEVLNAG